MSAGNPNASSRLATAYLDLLTLKFGAQINGEPAGGPSFRQGALGSCVGSPEGQVRGSPGDFRFRLDVPQLWGKASGNRTTTGWTLLTGDSPASEPVGEQLLITELNVGVCGSSVAFDCVALFEGAPQNRGSTDLVDWCTYVASATEGSSFKMRMEGLYHVDFRVWPGDEQTVFGGVSVDATGTSLNRNPVVNLPGIIGYDEVTTSASEPPSQSMVSVDCFVRVDADAADSPSGGIIRCHLSNGGNATPADVSTSNPLPYATITRVASSIVAT